MKNLFVKSFRNVFVNGSYSNLEGGIVFATIVVPVLITFTILVLTGTIHIPKN